MRQPKAYIFIGAPGSGKSTRIAEMAKKEVGNVMVLKHSSNIDDKAFSFLPTKKMSNWRQGAAATQPVKCKIDCFDDDEYFEFLNWVLAGNFKKGLLVIDDTTFFEMNQSSKMLRRLMTMRRHYQLDIILCYHGFTVCPIDNFVFANYVVLYKTNDNFQYKLTKLPNFAEFQAAKKKADQNFANAKTRFVPEIIAIQH